MYHDRAKLLGIWIIEAELSRPRAYRRLVILHSVLISFLSFIWLSTINSRFHLWIFFFCDRQKVYVCICIQFPIDILFHLDKKKSYIRFKKKFSLWKFHRLRFLNFFTRLGQVVEFRNETKIETWSRNS